MAEASIDRLHTTKARILFWGGVLFALVQLTVPVFLSLLDLQLRSLHVVLGVTLALLAFPVSKKMDTEKLTLWDIITVGIVIAANVNIFFKTMQIYMYPGGAGTLDLVLGVCLILVILDASRRTVGWAIPVLVALLFLYVYAGHMLPGLWKLKGLSLKFVLNSVYYSALGIYGSVTGMSATFISLFIIFGSLLSASGGGKTFIDIALALTGRFKGGPAKAAVVSSALFGSISGSAVANVSVTGNYTIPLMKRLGYSPEFAGAVEAIASTGGGITPPIMSITAFMMAEFLGMSYLRIIVYAAIPCLLFYTGVFGGVHFQTIKRGLASVPEEEIPRWSEVLTFRRLSALVIPTGILLGMIGMGRSLLAAGFYACVSALVLILITQIPEVGVKKTFNLIMEALEDGGRSIARIVPILVAVNILVNMIGITGIAPKISGLILEMGGENIFLALLIASIVPFLLGTSLPVVPTYVLSLSLLVPPLLSLGVDEVAAHLFFIYWALLGGVTPPTCTQAIVAAGIAKADWLKVGFISVKLGVVAFIVPYFFVLNPALVGRSDPSSVAMFTISAVAGAIALSYGLFGYSDSRRNFLLRALFCIGGFLLLFPSHIGSLIGLGAAVAAFLIEKMSWKTSSQIGTDYSEVKESQKN